MEGDFIKINEWLKPLSWLYGLGVGFRNALFEMGILHSRSFDMPVISVGNITVGGTGKTPHVEYLIRLLCEQFRVGVLSRGYKRKSHGFVLADEQTPMYQIGDEPYQMKHKFPYVTVAVDRDRCHGIEQLCNQTVAKDVDVILLDDAFQHRYVKPGINIILVDYHRLIIYDELLPAGRLREPLCGKNRADIVIITKCPSDLKPMEFRIITKAMNLYPYQHLYFTTLKYESLQGIFNQKTIPLEDIETDSHILLLTGIASPKQMIVDLQPHCKNIKPLTFADHHNFTDKDVARINDAYAALPADSLIITTEKDAARITSLEGLNDAVRNHIYALPVRVEFMLEQEDTFNQNIIGYVRKNSRNSILAKAKDDHKSKDSNRSGHRSGTISFRDH
jgi:tetraacyldisaccharide 4'-kinase